MKIVFLSLCIAIATIVLSCKTVKAKPVSTSKKPTTTKSVVKKPAISPKKPTTSKKDLTIRQLVAAIKNDKLQTFVEEWIATPYRYGGTTKEGVDCSGLISNAYQYSYNRTVKRTAGEQFDQCRAVSIEDVKEGDLVFFKIKSSSISHVGIYIGNNTFFHASSSQGVILSNLSEEYYQKYLYKVGRWKE